MPVTDLTLILQPLDGYTNVLEMILERQVALVDERPAFQKIIAALEQSDDSLYIVIDLSHNPRMPMNETIMEAFLGPYRHPRLDEWLVVRPNIGARKIAQTLTRLLRRDNIHWFDTYDDVLAYLDTVVIRKS
jgi:hypothetical protein